MKEILKLIRFDFITSENSTLPIVVSMFVICIIMAAFGVFNPVFGVFLFISCAAFFAPVQSAAENPDFRRVRGILPVGRTAFVRAEFAESIVTLLAGELITLILMGISRSSKLYEVFPAKLEAFCQTMHGFDGIDLGGGSFIKFVPLIILVCALLIVIVTFINMRSDIERHEHDIRNVLLIFSAVVIACTVSVWLVAKKIIPPYEKWLFPSTDAGTWIWGTALNAAAVSIGIIFCRITGKKTADYEI